MSLLFKLLVSFCPGDRGVDYLVPASSCFYSTSSYSQADIFISQYPLSILSFAFAHSITLPVSQWILSISHRLVKSLTSEAFPQMVCSDFSLF